jgi:Icc protein
MSTLTIAQITDIHIGQEGEMPDGVDVRKNFLSVLAAAAAEKPEHIVLSGDLCAHTGDRAITAWVRDRLDETGIPYSVIGGNHDETAFIAEVFGLERDLHDGELYYELSLKGIPLVMLDTDRGKISETQLAWLGRTLSSYDRPAAGKPYAGPLVFMHYPPVECGVPFMDAHYPLRNRAEAYRALAGCGYPVPVFCGHYHSERTVVSGPVTVFLTPSTFFQIAREPAGPNFRVDHRIPGFRRITVREDGIETTVRYLFPRQE